MAAWPARKPPSVAECPGSAPASPPLPRTRPMPAHAPCAPVKLFCPQLPGPSRIVSKAAAGSELWAPPPPPGSAPEPRAPRPAPVPPGSASGPLGPWAGPRYGGPDADPGGRGRGLAVR
ncbi:homeobox protein ESX1-like [Pithys albifrons albifrons]|uniref:homeobox protein ESX1-like n=1 Tax=Pithys albifrons albifrons TaxID=3385563 RepID=UPI003A5D1555